MSLVKSNEHDGTGANGVRLRAIFRQCMIVVTSVGRLSGGGAVLSDFIVLLARSSKWPLSCKSKYALFELARITKQNMRYLNWCALHQIKLHRILNRILAHCCGRNGWRSYTGNSRLAGCGFHLRPHRMHQAAFLDPLAEPNTPIRLGYQSHARVVALLRVGGIHVVISQ